MSNEKFPGFGVAKDGFGGYENFKLKDGEAPLTLGIFPPMGSCASTGEWSQYFSLHFGYKGQGDKDPTKSFHRPFLCLEERDFKSGSAMTTYQDAVDEILVEKTEARDAVKARLMAAGKTAKEISTDAEYKALASWLYDHSVDRKHRLLVQDQSGRYGVFKIISIATRPKNYLSPEEAKQKLSLLGLCIVSLSALGAYFGYQIAPNGWHLAELLPAPVTGGDGAHWFSTKAGTESRPWGYSRPVPLNETK